MPRKGRYVRRAHHSRPIVLMAAALVAFAILAPSHALAVPTFIVNSTLDLPDDLTVPGVCHTVANTCTLRAAVMQANRATGYDARIRIPPGIYKLSIPASGADGEESGDLDLTTPAVTDPKIAIIGAGAGVTIIDADQLDRVIHVHPVRMVSISGVTIRNGHVTGPNAQGGGIFNEGELTLNDTTVSGNHSDYVGGGITNYRGLMVTNSTVSQNAADLAGGGIANYMQTSVTDSTLSANSAGTFGGGTINFNYGFHIIVGSTIFGNSAHDGGGIYNAFSMTLTNSTVSQNTATNEGGGVYSGPVALYVFNSSIVFNGADVDSAGGGSAGGVYSNAGGGVALYNSLIAGNYVQNAAASDDCKGVINSHGNNLFGTMNGCTVNNAPGGSSAILNSLAMLGPLQDNGGPTMTHALLAGSNAIDGGDPVSGCDGGGSPLVSDQRGAARVAGVRCDVGAFEYGSPLPAIMQGVSSRKVHGNAGTFDLPLGSDATDPTTEPRQGPFFTIVFTFDKPIASANLSIVEGSSGNGPLAFSGNDVVVDIGSGSDQQYLTLVLTEVVSTDGGVNASASVRVGFLAGDVNGSRVVTVADLGLVNAQLAQTVTAANYLKDVNASGALTIADKGITNANLTHALPPP